ncbi:signal peptide peptidase SppA [Teredinibacter waterburyi]|uniref:signal peptide peptidase SppA n=1 Tax=Teredinibacter waterburyi TaxID=1500538 RepID=UPI00165EF79B|nr:signal peptide peptidase SppA [Teredinibacter waterburyi]
MFSFLGSLIRKSWQAITWLRTLFFNLLFLLIVVAIFASIKTPKIVTVPEATAILVEPRGFLVDQTTYNPSLPELLLNNSEPIPETVVRELVDTIVSASQDSRITSMVLDLNSLLGGGQSKLLEVGAALDTFKASGKPIYAYADNYTQQQYFLASYANKIFINELGNLLLTGFGVYQNYFKEAAEKLSLKFHVFRVGTYKDAVEPYIRSDMSPASREHNRQWIETLWSDYSEKVATNRRLNSDSVARYIDSVSQPPVSYLISDRQTHAQTAQKHGLIDEVVSRNALTTKLQELVGSSDDGNDFKAIADRDYQIAIGNSQLPKKSQIGLIVASGSIVDGHQPEGVIGSESFAELLHTARDDTSLSALIIRINSGGGSAFASEVIRQEILATRAAGLPVYISMGSVAASGGYWMATAGDEIWATPSTITGSIGVFGLIPNVNESLARIGISSDGIGTSPLADIYHPDRTLSEPAKNMIQGGVNDIYVRFLSLVAEARNLTITEVDDIAQGRVWLGSRALELGLVDHLGSLNDVIAAAAAAQSLESYELKEFRRPLTPMEEIMRTIMDETSVSSSSAAPLSSLTTLSNLASNPVAKKLTEALPNLSLSENRNGVTVMAKCLECSEL